MNKKRILRGFLFYVGGLVIGSFLVYQLWIKNRPDLPSVWPEGSVKQKIGRSQLIWDPQAACYSACYQLSDTVVKEFVSKGDVRFGVSKPRRNPHPVYVIDGWLDANRKVRMHIESADTTSALFKIEDLPGTRAAQSCDCTPVTY